MFFWLSRATTGEEAHSFASQPPDAQYNVLTRTVTIPQDSDAMYDVVTENIGKSNSSPLQHYHPEPVGSFREKDTPLAEYDMLRSSATKGNFAIQQQQPAPPTCDYAMIDKSKISRKGNETTAHEVETAQVQYSVISKLKPKKMQKKGKQKRSQAASCDVPPPVPPQMYSYKEGLLQGQDQGLPTNQFGSADTLLTSKHNQFPFVPEAQYDVITQ